MESADVPLQEQLDKADPGIVIRSIQKVRGIAIALISLTSTKC